MDPQETQPGPRPKPWSWVGDTLGGVPDGFFGSLVPFLDPVSPWAYTVGFPSKHARQPPALG